jgi:Putative addiction module component
MSAEIRLDEMSRADKLLVMEAIWDDLCRQAEGVVSPGWHEEVLAERAARYDDGKETAEDWADAKARIKSRLP